MLDIAMLDEIARPTGPEGRCMAPGLPRLDQIFDRIAADGWAPRNPAYGAELERLEANITSGACLNPLVEDGDIVYVDPDPEMPALPGDIVRFELSVRGAEVLGRPKGQQWLKLLANYRGHMMLLEKRRSACASLLAGEHPDDNTAHLAPVRNIRRRGRLLFAPAFAGDLGSNAATDVLRVEPADSSFHYGTWSGGTTDDIRTVATANYTNGTGQDMEVEVLTIGGYYLDNADPTSVAHYVYVSASGGISYSEPPHAIVGVSSASPTIHSSSRTGTLAAGDTITVTLNLRMTVSVGGTYVIPDAHYTGVSLSIVAIKK